MIRIFSNEIRRMRAVVWADMLVQVVCMMLNYAMPKKFLRETLTNTIFPNRPMKHTDSETLALSDTYARLFHTNEIKVRINCFQCIPFFDENAAFLSCFIILLFDDILLEFYNSFPIKIMENNPYFKKIRKKNLLWSTESQIGQ